MNLHHTFQTMARYNRWMNEKLYDTCARLSDEELKLDMKAFFGSIHGTLNHILLADRVWLARLAGVPCAIRSLDQVLYTEFIPLAQARKTTDNDLDRMMAGLSREAMDERITYRPISQGKASSATRGFILLHLFNHQTHHRGQVTSLISQLGHDVGVTDLIALPQAAAFD
ncbi:DinB family protein [Castellaniella hirudinis]|uniref:DinB family protein n=1 Tax=Castellaniella hirudinis TaxID=1144617 RepID=UPI0039C02758